MTRPDLKTLIEEKIKGEPEAAREFFGKMPTNAWQTQLIPGVDASQRILNSLPDFGVIDLAIDGSDKSIVTTQKAETPKQQTPISAPDASEDVLAMLRPKLRVDAKAGLAAILEAILAGKWSRKVIMLMPVSGPVNPHVMFSVIAQTKKQPWLGFHYEPETTIQRARNLCAQAFLASEADWSWWHDSDMACSFGSPGFFFAPPEKKGLGVKEKPGMRSLLEVPALEKLLSHNKTIVGGTYMHRRKTGNIVSQIGLNPANDAQKNSANDIRNKGFSDRLIEVDWIATGCALVHRKVYLDIQAKFPELAPKSEGEPWNFFCNDTGTVGEDKHFCRLAKEAGHQSYLDTSLPCAHVGSYAFFPGE